MTMATPRNTLKMMICIRFPSAIEAIMLLGNISVMVSAAEDISEALTLSELTRADISSPLPGWAVLAMKSPMQAANMVVVT